MKEKHPLVTLVFLRYGGSQTYTLVLVLDFLACPVLFFLFFRRYFLLPNGPGGILFINCVCRLASPPSLNRTFPPFPVKQKESVPFLPGNFLSLSSATGGDLPDSLLGSFFGRKPSGHSGEVEGESTSFLALKW